MTDSFNRTVDYLRVSVTDRCNLRCAYCMPQDGVETKTHAQILTFEEILRFCGIMAKMGVGRFKVTGGEPLVRRGTVDFIRELKKLHGVEQVTLTTNGVLLGEYLDELKLAGLDAVNISLDTLNEQNFEKLTMGKGVAQAVNAIEQAVDLGLPVKVNCVPIRGINETELVKIASFAREKNIAVRFIELMPVGLGKTFEPIFKDEIIAILQEKYGSLKPFTQKLGNGPAVYYSIDGFAGKIGFISAISHEFCTSCNRMRLTSDGFLKLCLSSDNGFDAKALMRGGRSDAEIEREISKALVEKPMRHKFAEIEKQTGHEKREMFRIGG